MTALECLKALKEFIKKNVADEMMLLKENTEDEYVHPNVSLMTLPHKNFVPVDFTVPYILIGLDVGVDDGDENQINIRVLCATYSSGFYDGETKLPDETGYIDLLNLLEKTKLELVENAVIDGMGSLSKPVNYGIYSEQITYPYSYGYLNFPVQLPINEYPMKEFL